MLNTCKYMYITTAPACSTCHLLIITANCYDSHLFPLRVSFHKACDTNCSARSRNTCIKEESAQKITVLTISNYTCTLKEVASYSVQLQKSSIILHAESLEDKKETTFLTVPPVSQRALLYLKGFLFTPAAQSWRQVGGRVPRFSSHLGAILTFQPPQRWHEASSTQKTQKY